VALPSKRQTLIFSMISNFPSKICTWQQSIWTFYFGEVFLAAPPIGSQKTGHIFIRNWLTRHVLPMFTPFPDVKPCHRWMHAYLRRRIPYFLPINIGTALAKNTVTILALRFVGGLVGSAPISIGGATLMEVYGPVEVSYAIAIFAVSGVCGPILGPVGCFPWPRGAFPRLQCSNDVCDSYYKLQQW
jgi:MFS family permease